MKLFLSLAIIAAFAMPVFANTGDVSQPTTKIAGKEKKKKKDKKKGATKDTGAPAAGGDAAGGGAPADSK